MRFTRRQLRGIIREEVNRSLITELGIPSGLKVLGDMIGFQPLPKLAKALYLAKQEAGVETVEELSDEMIRKHLECMDEFNEDSIRWVQTHKGAFPEKWVWLGGKANPWFKGCPQ
jgi:hypothetical protein